MKKQDVRDHLDSEKALRALVAGFRVDAGRQGNIQSMKRYQQIQNELTRLIDHSETMLGSFANWGRPPKKTEEVAT